MSSLPGARHDIDFGDESLPDWRESEELLAEADPDDEELDETPADVVAILGFDPKELDAEG